MLLCIHLMKKKEGKKDAHSFSFQEASLCVHISIINTVSKCSGMAGGCLASHGSWNTMTPARALFNYLLSFCPIDLHCEPFNYTIHHLLNMKNVAKRTVIKPRRKVLWKGPVNQANELCALCVCVSYVCMYVLLFLFLHVLPSITVNPPQQVDGGSMSLEAGAMN